MYKHTHKEYHTYNWDRDVASDPFHVGLLTVIDQVTGIGLAFVPRSLHQVGWLTGWLSGVLRGTRMVHLGLRLRIGLCTAGWWHQSMAWIG